jgi:hypothetical protein
MTGWQRIEYPLLQFVTMLIYLRFYLANLIPSVYRQRNSVAKGENLQFSGSESRADAPQVETMRAPSVTAKQKVDRRRLLTKIDGRGRVALRIAKLKALFATSLADREMTPWLDHKIGQAAELLAMAEKGRGDYLRGEHCQLDDVVRAERRAEAAVAALGIREAKPKGEESPLAAHFSRPVQRSAAP